MREANESNHQSIKLRLATALVSFSVVETAVRVALVSSTDDDQDA